MYPDLIKNLIASLSDLPGVSQRAATRYVFHLLRKPEKEIVELAKNLVRLKRNITLCSQCYNVAARPRRKDKKALCVVCQDPKRNQAQICVVEKISDIETIERLGSYKGVYHVLGGLISPVKNITPGKLTLKRLLRRLQALKKASKKPEVILALNPTREGDLTTNYLSEKLLPLKIKITRLGRGIPTGGEMQYADQDTLKEALERRREIS